MSALNLEKGAKIRIKESKLPYYSKKSQSDLTGELEFLHYSIDTEHQTVASCWNKEKDAILQIFESDIIKVPE